MNGKTVGREETPVAEERDRERETERKGERENEIGGVEREKWS